MAPETQSPAKAESGAAVESGTVEEKSADALEQIETLAGNPNDRRLVRTTMLELMAYSRGGRNLQHREHEFLDKFEQLGGELVGLNDEACQKIANAEIRDKDQRRKAELAEAKERRIGKEEREDRSQQRKDGRHQQDMLEREAELKRADECHQQDMLERETTRKDDSRERNLLLTLTAISVIATIALAGCTVVFLFLTAKYSQPWGYVGSGASLALTSIVGLAGGTPQRFRMLFSSTKADGENKDQAKDEEGTARA